MLNRCTADMFLIMRASVFSRFTSDQREWIRLQTTKKLTSIVSAERKWFRCHHIKSHILITLSIFSLAHSSQTGGGLLWGGVVIEPPGKIWVKQRWINLTCAGIINKQESDDAIILTFISAYESQLGSTCISCFPHEWGWIFDFIVVKDKKQKKNKSNLRLGHKRWPQKALLH